MSHWVSVYCQDPIKRFSASMLEKEIRRGCKDYRGYDYFNDLFAFAKVRQVFQPKSETSLFHLTYELRDAKAVDAGDGKVPMVLDRITDAETVAGMVQEQLEECLVGRRGPKAALVRGHLADIKEIYSFCLKQSHCDGAGMILIGAAREFLARRGKGMVREDGVGWMKLTPHGLFAALSE